MNDKLECTEFRIVVERTSILGELLVIKVDEGNEAFVDDDEIDKVIEFLQQFKERKSK